MARKRPPVRLAAAVLERLMARPGALAAPVAAARATDPDRPDRPDRPDPTGASEPEADQETAEAGAGLAAAGRAAEDPVPTPEVARRVVVRVPFAVKRRVQRHARHAGRSYTTIVLDAYNDHIDELTAVHDPTSPAVDPGATPRLPLREIGTDGRLRGVNAVDLPLSLYPAEREILEATVAIGAAHSLSDLVVRLLELALPAPPTPR